VALLTFTDEISPAGSNLTFTNTGFNNVTPGTGGTIQSDATRPLSGSFGAKFSPAASQLCSTSKTSLTSTALAVRIPLYMTALATADTYVASFLNGGTRLASIHLNGAGKLRLSNAAGTTGVATDPNTFPLNQWVYANLYVIPGTTTSNGSLRATIDNGAGTTIWDSGLLTGANTGTAGTITTVTCFKGTASNYATPFWSDFDQLFIETAATGIITPAGSAFTGTSDFSGGGTLSLTGSGLGSGAASFSGGGTLTTTGVAPAEASSLGYIGDSLTYQNSGAGNGDGGAVETAQAAVGWDAAKTRVDGLISRSVVGTGVTPSAPQVVASWRASGFDPKTWIIALGTNGANGTQSTQEGYIDSLLNSIAQGTTGVYRVYWVGLSWQVAGNALATTFQAALNARAAARTDIQLIPINYDALLHNGRDETGFWASDPHMTTTGYATRNAIIAAATPPSGPAYTGGASFSGGGTLTATGKPVSVGSAALSGGGTLTAAGAPRGSGPAALSGGGTLTTAGVMGGSGGAAAFSGSGTLVATGRPVASGPASFSGGGSLTVGGVGVDSGAPAAPGGMVMRLVAFTPNGASLGPVPTPQSVSVSLVLNDLGALSLAYPLEGPRSELLGQPVELAVLVSTDTGATWSEPPNARFLYTQDQRDPVKAEAYQIDCPSYAKRLDKALVPFTSLNADGQREFTAANPGMILNPLMGEAQARGALAGMSWDFSATVDSAGATWPVATRQNIAYAPGTSFLAILQAMVEAGLVDFRMSGRTLQMYAPLTTMAADRTIGTSPVSLRYGRDLTEAPFRRTWDALADTAYVQGDDRSSLIRTNGAAITPWGRQETFVTASGVTDTGTLTTVADAALSATDKARVERTYGLDFTRAPFLPLRDYAPGEWVYGATDPDVAPERMRVRQVTLTLSDQGVAQGNVVLNDRFLEADIMQARALSKLTGGATQGGTGSSPSGNDILAPAQVTGLGASTSAFVGAGGFIKAQITLDWNDTTTNADGTTASDIDHYEVHRRRQGDATWTLYRETPSSLMTDSPYEPNETWEFRVRAVDSVFNRGAFSSTVAIATAIDVTPPAVPSQPSGTSTVKGSIQIGWDGLTSAAGAMPADLAWVEVHVKTVNNFTPTPGDITTMVYRFRPGGGLATILNQPENTTMYVRLVAVDTSGNASAASTQRAVLVSKGSDGAVPTIPGGWAPTLDALGVGSLRASWPLVPNTDTVTYDVFLAEAAPVSVFDSTTKIGSTTGGALPISALPAGPLLKNTDYYLAVRVSDTDGYAAGAGAHGSAGPASVRLADVATISAGWVYAGTVNAAQIETGIMSADVIVGGKMYLGDAIVLDPLLGMTITQSNGDTTYMRSDGTGNKFSGIATLSQTVIQGNLSIQGITNVLAGQLRATNGYSDPTVYPLVAQDVVNRTAATGGRGYDRRGLTLSTGGNWVTTDHDGYNGSIQGWTKTGDPGPTFDPIINLTDFDCAGGVTLLSGKYWVAGHRKSDGTWRLRRYSSAGALEVDVAPNSAFASNRCAIGTDGTNVYLARINDADTLFVEWYAVATGAFLGATSCGTWGSAYPSGLYVGAAGGLLGASRYVVASRIHGTRVYSTAGARQTSEEWTDATTYTNQGLAFADGVFHRWNGETVWSFTDEPGGSKEFGVAWYRLQTTDAVGTAITPIPLETRVGITQTLNVKRFWRTKIVVPRAPNDSTDYRSPDTTKAYAGATGGTLYLQGSLPNTGTDTVTVNKLATATAEKLSSDYDSILGAVGKLFSTGLNLAGLPTWAYNGDGSGRAGPLSWDASGNDTSQRDAVGSFAAITTDANGDYVFDHNLGRVPTFLTVEAANTSSYWKLTATSPTSTQMKFRYYTASGVARPSTLAYGSWYVR
jgi:hypothetical protein